MALGDEDDPWALLESETSGLVETPSPGRLVQLANDEAAAALTKWLTAMGIASEIDDLRLQEEDRIVPAPGFYALKDEIEDAARVAPERADTVAMLVSTASSDEEAANSLRAAINRYGELQEARETIELGLRRLAQLAFGVSTLTLGGDRIERLERAAVAILHAPGERGRALFEESPRFFSTTPDELVVEVAGVLCRLLIDRSSTATFTAPAGQIVFSVDGETLIGTVQSNAGSSAKRWSHPELPPTARWESPVVVTRPATLTVETLTQVLGLETVSALTVSYGQKGDAKAEFPAVPPARQEPGWPTFLYWARRFYQMPNFEAEERNYKLKAVESLNDSRDRLLDGGDWVSGLKHGFTNKWNNLVSHWQFVPFLDWVEAGGPVAAEALAHLWTTDSIGVEERLDRFSDFLPAHVLSGPGVRCNLAVYLLGAVDPVRWPNYKVVATTRAFDLARYPYPTPGLSMGQLYRHALGFFDRILEEANFVGVGLLDRLDAQGVMWSVVQWQDRARTPFSVEEWARLLEFRAMRPANSGGTQPSAPKKKLASHPPSPVCPICALDDEVILLGPAEDKWLFVCETGPTHHEPYEFKAG